MVAPISPRNRGLKASWPKPGSSFCMSVAPISPRNRGLKEWVSQKEEEEKKESHPSPRGIGD